ncbi:MAG: hypothetical protein PHR30_18700 [Gallionellaceae bacterium]|nr:hypothetical protein [Gallionellaceae bacterium]
MTEGRNIFVCGRTGSGKTWLLQKRLLADVRRLVIYLPKAEEAGYAGVYYDVAAGEQRDFYESWFESYKRGRWHRLIYRPADPFDGGSFDRLCMGVYHAGACTFVAEDLAGYVNERSAMGPGFKTLLTAGRTRGVTCYLVTQRPYRIPREVTSQSREAYLFATHEPNDVAYIKEAFGVEAAAAMERAGQYEFVHWMETGQVEIGKA